MTHAPSPLRRVPLRPAPMAHTGKANMTQTLVLGIGNILLRDEGVGVHVVQTLRGRHLPEGVEIVDGGTAGPALIDFIADRPRVIVIDAVRANGKPGTVLRLTDADLAGSAAAAVSLHEVGLLEAILMARQLGCPPREIVIFGVIPKDMGPGLDLTPEVAAVVPKVADLVLAELGSELPRG